MNQSSDASTRFSDLATRLAAGDEQAAQEVFDRYAVRLIALARSKISAKFSPKFDAEDVVQSALRSFFIRNQEGAFELTGWEGLWGLLVRITLRKCGRNLERFTAAQRSVDFEANARDSSESGYMNWIAIEREPTPDEVVQLQEVVEAIMKSTDDARARLALELRLQGFLIRDIAERLNCTERTVQRKLDRFKSTLQRYVVG